MATQDQAADTMIANLETKTGWSLDGWIAIVRKSGLSKDGEIVNMLKSEHGIGHGYANLVAHKAAGSFNAMVTHRVRVEDAAAVDAELVGWLRRAWEQA